MTRVLKFSKSKASSKSPVRTPDTLVSTDTVEVLLGISEGPIKGLVNGPKTFYADNTPLLNSDGVANFKNFALDFYPGNETGHTVKLDLGGFASPINIGVGLSSNTPVVRSGFISGIDAVDFRIVVQQLMLANDKGSFTQELSLKFEVKKKTDAVWSPAWISVGSTPIPEYDPGDGNSMSWLFYGSEPQRGSFNGDIQVVETALPPSAPPADPSAPAVAVITTGVDHDGVYHWRPDIEDWEQDPVSTGNPVYDVLDDGRRVYKVSNQAPAGARPGDLWTTPFGFLISNARMLVWNGSAWVKPSEYTAPIPPTIASGIWTINEKVSSPTPKDIRVYLQDATEDDEWEYRVTKLSPNTTSEIFTEVLWESVQEITRTPMTFYGLAMARVIGRASDQFTALPNWGSDCDGRIVKVPTNYDPDTRVYTGVWDGTYKLAWTNCPAWVFQDFVENNRYGLSSIFPHVVNKWKIYEWAQYCDTMVLTASGALQPRWTYNDWIRESRDAKEMAQYIAGAAGARYVDDGNGIVEVIIDKDDPAIAIFGVENVGKDGFKYSYTDRLTRPNEVTVKFVNPNLNWEEDSRVVPNDDDIALYGRIPDTFVAVGCTDVDEALRRARYRLIGGLTEKEMVTFTTNRKGRFLSEWNVILVGDEDMGRGMTGRVRAVTGARSFTLRDPISFEPSIEYWATFDLVNPAYPATSSDPFITARRRIVNSAGAGQTTLTFATDLPALPEYAQFIIEAPAVLGFPKPYRITMLEDDSGSGDSIRVTALELNRNKWSYIDTGTGEVDPGAGTADDVLPPSNLKVAPAIKQVGPIFTRVLTISYDPSPSKWVRKYRLYHSVNGEAATVHEITGTTYDLTGVRPGSHVLTLVAVDIRGRESKPISTGYNTEGEARWVPSPQNLRIVGGVTETLFDTLDVEFAWEPSAEPDPYFSTFRVEIVKLATGFPVRVTDTARTQVWSYAFNDMKTDAGVGQNPPRSFKVNVYAVDQFGNQSFPATLTVSNQAPATPTIQLNAGAAGFEVILSQNAERDISGVLVWVSTTNGFNPLTTTPLVDAANQRAFFLAHTEIEPVYVRAAYYDAFDKSLVSLNISAQQTVTPLPLSELGADVLAMLEEAIDLSTIASENAAKAISDADKLAEATIRDALESLDARGRFLLLTHLGNDPVGNVIVSEIETRVAENLAMVTKTDTIISTVNGNQAFVETQLTTLATDISAESTARLTLASTVASNKALAESQIGTVATNLSAEVTARLALATQVGNNYGEYLDQVTLLNNADGVLTSTLALIGAKNGTSTAFIIDTSKAWVNGTESLGTRLTSINTSLGDNAGSITSEISNRISAVGSVQSQVNTLSGTVDGYSSQISTVQSITNAINARYSVTITSDSYGVKKVTGFVLNSNGVTGDFGVFADRFSISNSTGNVVRTPFVVVGSTVKMSNIEVDTIKVDTIYAVHIVSNEITTTVATSGNYGGSTGNPGGGAQVCEISVYCSGKPLLIMGMFSAKMNAGPGNINATANLYRNGNLLIDAGAYALLNYRYALQFVWVDNPGAGWHTYTIFDSVGGGANIVWYGYGLSATELKR